MLKTILSQNKRELVSARYIGYIAKEYYTERYKKLAKDVKKNYFKYMSIYTDKQMKESEIERYLKDKEETYTIHCIADENGLFLGQYKSEERCLEIIKEIYEAKYNYEMPKE